MAEVSSRLRPRTLLCYFRSRISSESFFPGNVIRGLGENGVVSHEKFRAGLIRGATFETSLADQNALIGSENSYRIRLASGNRVAAPRSFQIRATLSTSAYVKVLSSLNLDVNVSRGRPSKSIWGSFGLNATCSQSTFAGQRGSTSAVQRGRQSVSAGLRGRPAIIPSVTDGSQNVVARISNVPKFMSKSDLLWLLDGCGLTPEDLLYIYDSKYRIKFIQLQLASVESFQLVQRSLSLKGRFGGRFLKLTSEGFEMDDANKVLAPFRGRSLLMVKVPFGVMTEDVERVFSGFTLDSDYPIKFLRSPVQVFVRGSQSLAPQLKTEYEMRTLIRFGTEFEALRALREKQGAICLESPMELRFIW